jgi:hypothetical protein
MKKRCKYKNYIWYKNYWWRWITYDPKRETFDWFCEDMLEWYSGELTLDRIDNDWNYCKENCRWATLKEQARNKRNTVRYKNKCVSERAEIWWVPYAKAYRKVLDLIK